MSNEKKQDEKTEYVPKRDLVMEQRFTNDELLAMLPPHEKVDPEYVKGAIEFIMEHMEFHEDIYGYLEKSINNSFPRPTREQYREHHPYTDEYYEYFHGKDSKYRTFYKAVESEFLNRKGLRRSFEEACEIAADKWMEMIFGFHIQSNGDRESQASAMAMMMGTLLKDEAVNRCKADAQEKARQLFYEYYRNGSMYKGSRGHVFKAELYSDYGPNSPLYDILIKAGIDEKDAGRITPWKTGVEIDENDNTVVLIGYQSREYI